MKVNSLSFKSLVVGMTISSLVILAGCSTTLVSPYDEKLVTNTEAFYKKAAGIIEEGRAVSPKTDDARKQIVNPEKHEGHYSKFEGKYNQLIIDSEALILRAMVNSDEIDHVGQKLQAKLSDLIETSIPSKCKDIKDEFGKTSLTASNYIDLKCIITKWKEEHSDQAFTQNTQILKKANWEGRKQIIFNAVLAIQNAETFKKPKESK